jgi:hypothetical protein
MRIALFTPFSPEMGGGSVQLRSHIEQMKNLDIVWNYRASSAVPGEKRRWLGPTLTVGQFGTDISRRTGYLPGSTAAIREMVSEMDADLYWIVAHYEGISVAAELLARGKKVHLTVHDEPLGMSIRSRRYWTLYPLIGAIFKKVLLEAKSVDVTSWGMRDLFNSKYGLNCFALYRSLSVLPPVSFGPKPGVLRIGHIGSLYHPDPFQQFVKACRRYATERNLKLEIVRVGASPEMDKVASQHPEIFESLGEMEESKAIPILANCDFLYAMYPEGIRFRGFRRTSLPIKLSTYIQAQRPIFAHTPGDSNMAKIVSQFKVGLVCTSSEEKDLQRSIEQILRSPVQKGRFEAVREGLMGETQVEQLREALTETTGNSRRESR